MDFPRVVKIETRKIIAQSFGNLSEQHPAT